MCVKELANIAGVFPPEGENDDSYKNPGSGQAKPKSQSSRTSGGTY